MFLALKIYPLIHVPASKKQVDHFLAVEHYLLAALEEDSGAKD